jgi:hypothetical protein
MAHQAGPLILLPMVALGGCSTGSSSEILSCKFKGEQYVSTLLPKPGDASSAGKGGPAIDAQLELGAGGQLTGSLTEWRGHLGSSSNVKGEYRSGGSGDYRLFITNIDHRQVIFASVESRDPDGIRTVATMISDFEGVDMTSRLSGSCKEGNHAQTH